TCRGRCGLRCRSCGCGLGACGREYSRQASLVNFQHLPPITGWFDPAPKGGFLRLAANSYLPAKGDPPVRLPGLRRGDLLTLENGRVVGVNRAAPGAPLGVRPEFAQLGPVLASRPLSPATP